MTDSTKSEPTPESALSSGNELMCESDPENSETHDNDEDMDDHRHGGPTLLSDWMSYFGVLYKTQLILCTEIGGEVKMSIPLWTVLPTSISVCMDSHVKGTAVLEFMTADQVKHFLDFNDPQHAGEWMTAFRDLQAQRGDAELVGKFIRAETQRLAEKAEIAAQATMSATLEKQIEQKLGTVGKLVNVDGETRWVGDGVRKGIVGCDLTRPCACA